MAEFMSMQNQSKDQGKVISHAFCLVSLESNPIVWSTWIKRCLDHHVIISHFRPSFCQFLCFPLFLERLDVIIILFDQLHKPRNWCCNIQFLIRQLNVTYSTAPLPGLENIFKMCFWCVLTHYNVFLRHASRFFTVCMRFMHRMNIVFMLMGNSVLTGLKLHNNKSWSVSYNSNYNYT